ncbi:MAG: UDP-N-acetylmuramate dehydrogenase [Gammaproteobacteria bacterium]|nr:MAG: UDP-N-acetylmuramate dehydrogenase [Gammaproteobacteria bacterium]
MMPASTQNWNGLLLTNEPMANHTSWRVGGPADYFYQPTSIDDLAIFLRESDPSLPLTWLGLGSNLLVRDGGLRGIVIHMLNGLNNISLLEQVLVRVEVGVSSARVARFCANSNLTGAEFLAGIPGLFGGALTMNAGAFGYETWQIVDSVEMIDRSGNQIQRSVDDFAVDYRSVHGPGGEWFVAANLRLKPCCSAESKSRVRNLLQKRNESQPVGTANAGSVFKNPPGDFAARLIEVCGLKGSRIGGACVSGKHANFIVNTGGASAADIEALILHIQTVVSEQEGIKLQPEVHIIGEADHA